MEAKLNILNRGNRYHCVAMAAVALFAALESASCSAQSVRAATRSGSQQIRHSLKNAPQSFSPVRWDVINTVHDDGCIVEWTAEPFIHLTEKSAQADCELSIRLVRGTRFARWRVTNPSDASDVSGGKNSASVSLTARREGRAQVELLVRFLEPNSRLPVSGSYRTTVVSTISGL